MEEPNNDIDTEMLQAQIDLAMAQAQNLVASWLPDSQTTQTSSRTAETEAELQVLLRRPPRLGVGAPLPESHAPAQARLVQKLRGGKKHARKTENGIHSNVVGVEKKKEEGESSEEESRVGTTRKRTIVDPFEPAGKKGKKRRKEVEEVNAATGGTEHTVQQHHAVGEGMVHHAFGTTAGPTPKKKKIKKKGIKPEGQQGPEEHNGEARSAHTDGSTSTIAQTQGPFTQSLVDTREEKLLRQESRDASSEASDTGESGQHTAATPAIGVTSATTPGQPLPGSRIQLSPTSLIPTGSPTVSFPSILNLAGPPSVAPENVENQPRKKRRRKRKKKKPAGDPL